MDVSRRLILAALAPLLLAVVALELAARGLAGVLGWFLLVGHRAGMVLAQGGCVIRLGAVDFAGEGD